MRRATALASTWCTEVKDKVEAPTDSTRRRRAKQVCTIVSCLLDQVAGCKSRSKEEISKGGRQVKRAKE